MSGYLEHVPVFVVDDWYHDFVLGTISNVLRDSLKHIFLVAAEEKHVPVHQMYDTVQNRLLDIKSTGLFKRDFYSAHFFQGKTSAIPISKGEHLLCLLADLPLAVNGISGLENFNTLLLLLLQHLVFLGSLCVSEEDNKYDRQIRIWYTVLLTKSNTFRTREYLDTVLPKPLCCLKLHHFSVHELWRTLKTAPGWMTFADFEGRHEILKPLYETCNKAANIEFQVAKKVSACSNKMVFML